MTNIRKEEDNDENSGVTEESGIDENRHLFHSLTWREKLIEFFNSQRRGPLAIDFVHGITN